MRGDFRGSASRWDVGARAKQTSLFLKFIPSLASGHNWVINVVCISKFSCTHTGCSLSQQRGSNGLQGCPGVLSKPLSWSLLISCSILSQSPLNAELTVLTPNETPWCWECQCLLSWYSTLERSCLTPAQNDLLKFPAPPLTCFYFTSCKGKTFLIQ